jgi:hypothetical protein
MNRISIAPFSATITMGLQRGYADELINKSDIIFWLQNWQDQLIEEKQLRLSVCISECEIVFSGQIEPHLKLSMINYPKFPLKEQVLKGTIERLVTDLMKEFDQNRMVIEFPDETVMLENTDAIDPRIKNGDKKIF